MRDRVPTPPLRSTGAPRPCAWRPPRFARGHHLVHVFHRQHPSAALVVGVLQAHDARDWGMLIVRADRRLDLIQWDGPVRAVGELSRMRAHQRRGAPLLVLRDVTEVAADVLRASNLAVHPDGDEITHRAARNEHRSLLPENLRHRRSNASTVGSSPKTSSPTSASAIALRMRAVGFVTVSDRRSTTRTSAGETPGEGPTAAVLAPTAAVLALAAATSVAAAEAAAVAKGASTGGREGDASASPAGASARGARGGGGSTAAAAVAVTAVASGAVAPEIFAAFSALIASRRSPWRFSTCSVSERWPVRQ